MIDKQHYYAKLVVVLLSTLGGDVPPKQVIHKWVSVGLTKTLYQDLCKYIREHEAHGIHSEGDAIREFIQEGVYDDTMQRNIELTVLLRGLDNVKTKEEALAWNKEKERLLGGS